MVTLARDHGFERVEVANIGIAGHRRTDACERDVALALVEEQLIGAALRR